MLFYIHSKILFVLRMNSLLPARAYSPRCTQERPNRPRSQHVQTPTTVAPYQEPACCLVFLASPTSRIKPTFSEDAIFLRCLFCCGWFALSQKKRALLSLSLPRIQKKQELDRSLATKMPPKNTVGFFVAAK